MCVVSEQVLLASTSPYDRLNLAALCQHTTVSTSAFCRSESWVEKGQAKDQKSRSHGEKSGNLSDTIFVELCFRDETTNCGLI